MAADLGWSHFMWAGSLIMFFQMKLKFQTVYDFTQFFFSTGLLCFSSDSLYPESITAAMFTFRYQKMKGLLECL